jgi:hypothetical protein
VPKHEPAQRPRIRPRGRTRRGPAGRRIGLLLGTAALGAVGFGLISPAAPPVNIAAAAAVQDDAGVLGDRSAPQHVSRDTGRDAAAIQALNDPVLEKTGDGGRGASAAAQEQARAQTLAATAAQRSAEAVASAAAARESADSGTAGRDAYRAYARTKVGAAQFGCLDLLWERESNWRPNAQNPTSTAYGIAQLLDTTWSVTGIAKTSNGFRQIDAGLAYLAQAYPGGPCSAWTHETSYSWY